MINANMREYNYFLLSAETDDYGQQTLIKDENGEPIIQGTIKMAISEASQSVLENILYKNTSYVGITQDKAVNDHYIIEYKGIKLKVQYISESRFKTAYLGEYHG